jgi:hypothetical protein
MTEPITKPDHHRVPVEHLRAWRTATGIDTQMSICMYCDEEVTKNKQPLCSLSCGTYSVWVDTPTLAQITLEMS